MAAHPKRGSPGTTSWTLVMAAGGAASPEADEALARLCELYWFPVYAFIRRQGHGSDEAADLTQEFFARLRRPGLEAGLANGWRAAPASVRLSGRESPRRSHMPTAAVAVRLLSATNVLVARGERGPVLKVLDFGHAELLG
jgi:hypothetical protein